MDEYLIFRLYGLMASWGDIAVGEVRRSASYPSRSAILGIISAALGIRREEVTRLDSVFSSYDVAVKVLSFGTLLNDYHTVQVPAAMRDTLYITRRDEIVIGRDHLGTILSTREYRCDSFSIVSIRTRENPPYSLEVIKDKLEKPEFILYLGRKSCPLAAPLKPQIIYAGGFREALDKGKFPPLVVSWKGEDTTRWYIKPNTPRYFWEGNAGDMEPQETHERYDDPQNRMRWQFAPRSEHWMTLTGGD